MSIDQKSLSDWSKKERKELLLSPGLFDPRALRRKNWVAVAIQERITDNQAHLISNAALSIGVSKGMAITASDSAKLEIYCVPLTEEGILDFDSHCMLRPFLLVADNCSFAVLEEGDYYYLIAGTVEFVDQAVFGGIETARHEFEKYIESFSHRQLVRDWLQTVVATYAD